ncbi:hypothetical protein HY991_06035, partial [Candidatus Micrarchaeota archaeon]|nr:hypothetical protein [Candidatus Micrarchaeota archaeon]
CPTVHAAPTLCTNTVDEAGTVQGTATDGAAEATPFKKVFCAFAAFDSAALSTAMLVTVIAGPVPNLTVTPVALAWLAMHETPDPKRQVSPTLGGLKTPRYHKTAATMTIARIAQP